MARTMDMTSGKPARLILAFALPMLMSSLFQQFYGMVDTIVVGRGVGTAALAAVGATGSLHFLILGFATGLTYGFGTLFSQRFGAGDIDGLRHAVGAGFRLSALIGGLITVLAIFGAGWLLRLLSTPDDIFSDASLYLTVVFAAIPITILFNLLATLLRSVGDSKTPLIAMLISSAVNILLDLLFVFTLRMGVLGVAIATDIAQLASCAVCYLGVRKSNILRLEKNDLKPDRTLDRQLLMLGVPVALMNSVTAAGSMLLQAVVNGFGSTCVAGYTAAKKLIHLFEEPGLMVGMALGVYTGQNLGAGRVDRVRAGIRSAICISLVLNLVLSAIMYFGRDPLVSLFLQEGERTAVLPVSGQMLTVTSLFLWILGLLFVYRCSLQGIGDTTAPMLSGVLELGVRMAAALSLKQALGFLGVCIAEVGAWIAAAALLCAVCYMRLKRLKTRSISSSAN